MTKLTLTLAIVAGLALSGLAFLACTPTPTPKVHETAGEFIDDSVITTRVKAAILEEATLKSLEITVKTYKDVVQLSGFVDSADSRQRAGKIAAAVNGVTSVKNDLIVKS
jgi:osmotically-inducible protein OsmY